MMVRFHDRVLTSIIPADVTSIDMSQYYPSHPQYYLIYNITIQALHGDDMVAGNSSEPVIASELRTIPQQLFCMVLM